MTRDLRPLDKLRRLAAQEASGELISSGPSAEVHVFLQRGRIAWATDSEHPFAFTRHLQQSTQIDTESFKDILESCKREKRPLGETLVSWGAASWEDVRAALRHQIELALSVLGGDDVEQSLFLDRTRQFAPYNADLTFDISELVAESPVRTPVASKRPGPLPRGMDLPPASVLARGLVEGLEGVVWAEVLDGTAVIESMPTTTTSRVGCDAVETTVLDGAELVALRSADGTLAGATLGNRRSLWCRLTVDATFGVAISALSQLADVDKREGSGSRPMPMTSRGDAWVIGAADAPVLGDLRDFVERAPESIAAIVTGLDGEVSPCGIGRGGVDPERATSVIRRRAKLFRCAEGPFRDATPQPAVPDATADLTYKSLVVRESDLWCFGAELSTQPVRIVWLLIHRAGSQGLGWAYLTSLSRQLMRVRDWGRRG